MCFILHIASEHVLPRRAWNEQDRQVWISDVDERSEPVRMHFSLPDIAYLGSDVNCGCGFRHLSFQGGGWPEEYLVEAGTMETEGTQKNHQELHAVLIDALRHSGVVELYGCWDGDYAEKTEGVCDIEPDAIVAERFFFRERVLYRVAAGSSAGSAV